MIKRLIHHFRVATVQRSLIAGFARGSVTSQLREIDPKNPNSWEFSAFSDGGEDGILDYLCRKIENPNRYFIEIGSANGYDNCTAWLAYGLRYGGLMVEANVKRAEISTLISNNNVKVQSVHFKADKDNSGKLIEMTAFSDPDVLSVDIDGIDYYVVDSLFKQGLKPKIIVAEYNATFGPTESITIKYDPEYYSKQDSIKDLYFGVSIAGWKTYLAKFGYQFLCVERSGVNGFFVRSDCFRSDFIRSVRGLEFADNLYQLIRWKIPWQERFGQIKNLDFRNIE